MNHLNVKNSSKLTQEYAGVACKWATIMGVLTFLSEHRSSSRSILIFALVSGLVGTLGGASLALLHSHGLFSHSDRDSENHAARDSLRQSNGI
ncbi:MAG: hypothetical protein A3F42_04365 [Gammaproteobacteria bacterium RIFCSPHIGHO2_12_FULL_37_34]|nr:MAG: hypothetical protein A3F42_04365 [Gammaproteobacteria bacterium RIFCSPHIGHO2_12_FULL_37_34]